MVGVHLSDLHVVVGGTLPNDVCMILRGVLLVFG
jgi:hypothetical protein